MKPLNKNLLTFEEPKLFKGLETFKPNYNYLKALAGIGLITGCLLTPATNWAIVLIVPIYIGQRPVNYDKLRETKIGKKLTQIKLIFSNI